jgi:hypothetical protein
MVLLSPLIPIAGLFILELILILIIKAIIWFLPAIMAPVLVWLFLHGLLLAAIAFVVVAILAHGHYRYRRYYYPY